MTNTKKSPAKKKPAPKTKTIKRKNVPEFTPAEKNQSSWIKILIKYCFSITLWSVIAGLIGLLIIFFTLPNPHNIIDEQRRPPSITMLDRHGDTLYQIRGYAAQPARIDQLPKLVPDAFLAMEDRRFYQHFGVDPIGIARAIWTNMMAGGIRQGGSTITQQVAKNLFLTPKRTVFRKSQEALLALWLENTFSKQQILEIYLNRIYLGSGIYGIEAAAQQYFGKSAANLSVTDISLLAGLPKAPSRYSPIANPKSAQNRAKTVLEVLKSQNLISNDQFIDAHKNLQNVHHLPVRQAQGAHFHSWINQQLENMNLIGQGDLIVYTTLDAQLQNTAETQFRRVQNQFTKQNIEQAALISIDKKGAIRAMIGSVPWRNSQFNRATQAKRQVGSVFKIFVYASAFEAGYEPDTVVTLNPPEDVEIWWPEDILKNKVKHIDLRTAMAQSSNAMAVTLTEAVGRENTINMAHRMGVSSSIPNVPSVALGTAEIPLIEMTSAISIIATEGINRPTYGIDRITNGDNQEIFRNQPIQHRVLGQSVVLKLQDILAAVVQIGTGKVAKSKTTLGGKTGTTQHNRDALFIGYGNDLTTGIWLGNDNGEPMDKTSGGGLPAQLFSNIAKIFPH